MPNDSKTQNSPHADDDFRDLSIAKLQKQILKLQSRALVEHEERIRLLEHNLEATREELNRLKDALATLACDLTLPTDDEPGGSVLNS